MAYLDQCNDHYVWLITKKQADAIQPVADFCFRTGSSYPEMMYRIGQKCAKQQVANRDAPLPFDTPAFHNASRNLLRVFGYDSPNLKEVIMIGRGEPFKPTII